MSLESALTIFTYIYDKNCVGTNELADISGATATRIGKLTVLFANLGLILKKNIGGKNYYFPNREGLRERLEEFIKVHMEQSEEEYDPLDTD